MASLGEPLSQEDVYKLIEKVSLLILELTNLLLERKNIGLIFRTFQVRCETHLSHKLSCHAVYVVMEKLASLRPSISVALNDILKILEIPPEAPESLIDETRDMARLFIITEDLDSVRNDVQQRSWELFDDQATIMEYLNELYCILVSICIEIVRSL